MARKFPRVCANNTNYSFNISNAIIAITKAMAAATAVPTASFRLRRRPLLRRGRILRSIHHRLIPLKHLLLLLLLPKRVSEEEEEEEQALM